jgi:hypothetical protein
LNQGGQEGGVPVYVVCIGKIRNVLSILVRKSLGYLADLTTDVIMMMMMMMMITAVIIKGILK